ncbi:MAG: aspartyl protease family protein, partial [Acidobacteriaceae bacterium]|nr:aspartyl protease family protein [Acidobacteriaceae bacterium]
MYLQHKMRFLGAILCLIGPLALPCASRADTDPAMAAYKAADYATAIPQLEAACNRNPKDPLVHAALLSALVYEGAVDQAFDAADAAAAAFPDSPDVLAARGEFAFYMGDMPEAEKLFRAAGRLRDQTARAYYGLYHLYLAASMYRTGRLFCLKAHDIDPDDALITRAWMRYLVPEKRREVLGPFVQSHPWLFENAERDRDANLQVAQELNARKIFEPEGEPKDVTVRLSPLLYDPSRIRGFGIEFKIEGGRPLKLLLDTGASGILVRQGVIDKAELEHLGSGEAWGIGDAGVRKTFSAIANSCEIGGLKYKACLIRATEGKQRVGGEEDGLIGADVFSDYLLQIDFRKRLLHLTPLPARPPNPQGYDREIGRDRAGFTPVFRDGDHLFVTTRVNDKNTGLFLIDTGASMSNIDSTFARLSTKIRGDDFMRVRGVSGQVKDVFEADKAFIQFARFRQKNLGLTSFNLNNYTGHQDIRMSGILGLPILAMFRLTIDYR